MSDLPGRRSGRSGVQRLRASADLGEEVDLARPAATSSFFCHLSYALTMKSRQAATAEEFDNARDDETDLEVGIATQVTIESKFGLPKIATIRFITTPSATRPPPGRTPWPSEHIGQCDQVALVDEILEFVEHVLHGCGSGN